MLDDEFEIEIDFQFLRLSDIFIIYIIKGIKEKSLNCVKFHFIKIEMKSQTDVFGVGIFKNKSKINEFKTCEHGVYCDRD